MKFSTKEILKSDKKDFCEGVAILKQYPYNVESKDKKATKFELNVTGMKELGLEPFKSSGKKLTHGIDADSGSPTFKQMLLANINGEGEDKHMHVTNENTFSNLTFMNKLVKQFGIDPSKEHLFKLNIEDCEGFKVATLEAYVEESFEGRLDHETMENNVMEEAYPGHNKVMESVISTPSEEFDTIVNRVHSEHSENKSELF